LRGRIPIVGYNRAYGAVLERLAGLAVPTIAVVAGAAVGGGVGFVAASDFTLAHAGATFRLPEVTLGLPPAQVAPFVADRIGRVRALQLMLTAELLDAQAALRCGWSTGSPPTTPSSRRNSPRTLAALERGGARGGARELGVVGGDPSTSPQRSGRLGVEQLGG